MSDITFQSINPAEPSAEFVKIELLYAVHTNATLEFANGIRVDFNPYYPWCWYPAANITHSCTPQNGNAYLHEITFNPRFSPAIEVLRELKHFKHIIRLTDNNGKCFIVGSKTEPLTLTFDTANQGAESGSSITVTLSGSTLSPLLPEV